MVVGETADAADTARAVPATVIFVLGFATVFTLLGTLVGLLGGSLSSVQDGVQRVGGVIVVEQVFGLNGLGQDSVQAIDTGNLPVIIGFVLVASFFVVAANIIVDAAYALLDPRVRIS